MNLNFTKAQWNDTEKTSFTLEIQDLDKEFLNGEIFPFTHIIGNNDSEIAIEVEKAYKDLDIADFVQVLPTLEEVKSAKLSELATKAQAFENNVNKDMWFKSSVKGYLINGDRRTRSNIEDLITYHPTDIVIYRDYENIERNLTKDELKIMLKELVMNGQMLYNQKWEFEKKINACTSVDELNKIEISFIMQDFSENVSRIEQTLKLLPKFVSQSPHA